MGVSSSNSILPLTTISSEYEAETSSYSRDAYLTNDNGRQRTHIDTSTYNGETEPQSQLTHTAQMTDWQPADDHDPPMCQQNHEVVDLSQIISQLAMANHQLANAHNATLARMEVLYLELSKEREDRKRTTSMEVLEICDGILRRRLQSAEENVEREEMHRLEQRVIKLESLLAATSVRQCKQRDFQENNKLRSRIERLENLLWTRETKETKENYWRDSELHCESSHIAIDAISEVSEELDKVQGTIKEEMDVHRNCSTNADDAEMNVLRIDENKCSMNVYLDRMRRRCARLRKDEQYLLENSEDDEILKLSEEVERLQTDRFEYQNANERLLSNLAKQRNLMEKLNSDYEELKTQHATAQTYLHKHKQQYDELTKHLDSAKKEIESLLKEITIFQSEKDTANVRILILEQDLQKLLVEKEQIKNAENQKISKLRTQLSEEVSDKKKQIKALEDALQEIQRLKETIKTEKKNEDDIVLNKDIGIIDSIHDTPESTSNSSCAATNIEEFKKELTLKREARQRAIAAVSSEMERLRQELDTEKEAHSKTLNKLALLRSTHSNLQDFDTMNEDLVKTMIEEKNANEKTLRDAEAQRLMNILKVSDELRNDIRYQIEKVDDLRYHLETDSERHRYRIQCLMEVTKKAREFLFTRERGTNEVKDYLAQLLVRLDDGSYLEVKDDIAAECSRQLENINTLKSLYNERLRVLTELKDSAIKDLTEVRQKLEYSVKKSESLEEELRKAEDKVDAQDSEITNLESQLGLTKADCRDLQNQMSLINGLFTQMLLGASSADMDLDRLTQLLQENHDLISDIAREESTEAAALPKLLLDLIEQVEGGKVSQKQMIEENMENNSDIDKKEDDLQEEDIAHNLPKVWRVLLELLSCHAVTSPSISVASCSDPNSCYKSVDTPAGPRLVISVSKTYIRLKELILEKKHLEKEMSRMKQLNTHLESKLGEQEKRLSMVSVELTKTWNIVGRMQAQHQQLHTHEEILRYELQQKRKMLQELKQELEYCREKWESARQKNTNTELEWRNLRREFAARKALAARDSFNSAESGFSDERGDDTDEEEEVIEGRIRHGLRRRTRKESLRALTPDTESEQPTDTELSESKTGSLATLEQRTSTPETETELDEIEVADIDSIPIQMMETDHVAQEVLHPLDQALTNVIQNLIRLDDGESRKNISILQSDITDTCGNFTLEINSDLYSGDKYTTTSSTDICGKNQKPWTPAVKSLCSLPALKTLKQTSTSIDLPSTMNNDKSIEVSSIIVENSSKEDDDDGEIIQSNSVPPLSSVSHTSTATIMNIADMMPVFSIGPFPTPSIPFSSIKNVQFSNPLIMGLSNHFFAPVFDTAESENSVDKLVTSSSLIQSSSMTLVSQEGESMEKKERSSKLLENIIDSDSISVDSSSSLDTVREFPMMNSNLASSSILPSKEEQETMMSSQKNIIVTSAKSRTPEEVLAARSDRLKNLEEQADWLVKKMNATNKRGSALCTRLEELHDTYGEPPVPPPMPDILPSCRLPSSLSDLPHQISESSSASNIKNTESRSTSTAKDDMLSSNANSP